MALVISELCIAILPIWACVNCQLLASCKLTDMICLLLCYLKATEYSGMYTCLWTLSPPELCNVVWYFFSLSHLCADMNKIPQAFDIVGMLSMNGLVFPQGFWESLNSPIQVLHVHTTWCRSKDSKWCLVAFHDTKLDTLSFLYRRCKQSQLAECPFVRTGFHALNTVLFETQHTVVMMASEAQLSVATLNSIVSRLLCYIKTNDCCLEWLQVFCQMRIMLFLKQYL